MNIILIAVFWGMQILAQIFFKWGSTADSRWIWGFLIGNLFGFSSIWLLMLVYKAMNPNIALGICGGGAFLLSQLVMWLVFRPQMSSLQWTGVLAIVVGMLLLSMTARTENERKNDQHADIRKQILEDVK